MLSMLSLLATDAKRAGFGLSFWLPRLAEVGLQPGGGKGTDGKRNGAVGADLLQSLEEPGSGIEQAMEMAALMLGADKSRGYCLEMICADFLAGAHLDDGNPGILLHSISRYYKFLPGEQQRAFLENLREKVS